MSALLGAIVLCGPAVTAAADRVLYYHNDALGSPVAMTDAGGTIVWKADYQPFGDLAGLTENAPNSHQFTGKEVDQETGLQYFGARFYDQGFGRFLSVDPILLRGRPSSALRVPQRLNFYAYSTNNPYRYLDRDGRWLETALDVVSLGVSIEAYQRDASILNGLALAYDSIATAVPILPAGAGLIISGAVRAVTSTIRGANETGDFVSVYHGSINDYHRILAEGLDPSRGTSWASRDIKAAKDAIGSDRYEVSQGLARDPGVIESRIPRADFERVLAPTEIPYPGFSGKLNSTEIRLRTPEATNLFNQNIVRGD